MEVRCAPRDGCLIRTRRTAGKKTTSYNMSRGRATRPEMNTVAQNSRTNPEAPRKTKPVRMDQPIQNAKRYQKKNSNITNNTNSQSCRQFIPRRPRYSRRCIAVGCVNQLRTLGVTNVTWGWSFRFPKLDLFVELRRRGCCRG